MILHWTRYTYHNQLRHVKLPALINISIPRIPKYVILHTEIAECVLQLINEVYQVLVHFDRCSSTSDRNAMRFKRFVTVCDMTVTVSPVTDYAYTPAWSNGSLASSSHKSSQEHMIEESLTNHVHPSLTCGEAGWYLEEIAMAVSLFVVAFVVSTGNQMNCTLRRISY